MNKRRIEVAIGLTVASTLAAYAVRALAGGIPSPIAMYYAGTLTEGGQLVNGPRSLTVNIWADATSQGDPLCSTVASPAVNVVNGQFRIALAGACKSAVNANNNTYIEVIDGATSLGRTPMGAVPYAVEADHAVNADHTTNADNATYSADAGHAALADNATNAASASSLAAAGASGGLSNYAIPGDALVAPCVLGLAGGATVDCTCPAGGYIVSGGAYVLAPGYIRESRPLTTTTWRVTCASGANDVMCAYYQVLCSRLGP
jgi:hypothetical protein